MITMKNFSLYAILTIATITNNYNYSSENNNVYKTYIEEQKQIDTDVSKLNIPGTRALHIDETLVEAVLTTCPKEIEFAISQIEQNIFRDHDKNIILQGLPGTGKFSTAQAIAIKSKTPCLVFYVGSMFEEHPNLGLQHLNKILKYAKHLEEKLKKPCIIILSELDTLIKKHPAQDNFESQPFINFCREFETLNNSKTMIIGTMNSLQDLPLQITDRTSIIKFPLPEQPERQNILSYHLCANRLNDFDKINSANLAQQTTGFTHRELQNVVIRATRLGLSNKNNPIVNESNFITAIKQVKKDPKRKLAREIGTWKYSFKARLSNFKPVHFAISTAGLCLGCYGLSLQTKSLENQEKSIAIQIETKQQAKDGITQSKEIAEKQMSATQIGKQSAMNISVFGIPIGTPIYWLYRASDEGVKYISSTTAWNYGKTLFKKNLILKNNSSQKQHH